MSTSEGIMARWITQLSVYDIAVFYRKGADNTAADFLSRRDYTDAELSTVLLDADLRLTAGRSRPRMVDTSIQTTSDVASIVSIAPTTEIATLQFSELRDALVNHIGMISSHKSVTKHPDRTFGLPTDWRLEQELDHEITYVVRHLHCSTPPNDLNEQSDATKRLWATYAELVFDDGYLYYVARKPPAPYVASTIRALVVPNKWRVPLTMFYHASKNMAHAGPFQTYQRLMQTYWWPNMNNDIKTTLANCDICQRVKSAPTNMRAPLQPIVTNKVFERVHIDLMGPMANSHGYKYILVIIDAFSRWIEAVPLTNKRAETVAWALLTTWICRYGWMDILHSDNGTEFVNEVLANICEWLGIIRTTTTAYHPQGNGMCERANRSLKQALTCLLLEYGTGWFKALPFALWCMRSAIHRVTGCEPYQLLFARNMRTPYDFYRSEPNARVSDAPKNVTASPSDTVPPSQINLPTTANDPPACINVANDATKSPDTIPAENDVAGPSKSTSDVETDVATITSEVTNVAKGTSHDPISIIPTDSESSCQTDPSANVASAIHPEPNELERSKKCDQLTQQSAIANAINVANGTSHAPISEVPSDSSSSSSVLPESNVASKSHHAQDTQTDAKTNAPRCDVDTVTPTLLQVAALHLSTVIAPICATPPPQHSPDAEIEDTYCEYVATLIKLFQHIHDQVRRQMQHSVAQIKRNFDRRSKARHFRPGQLVLVKIPVRPSIEAPGEKFYPRWHGPFQVLFRFDDGISYRLLDTDTNIQRTENVNNIKPYSAPYHDATSTRSSTTSPSVNRVHVISCVSLARANVYTEFRYADIRTCSHFNSHARYTHLDASQMHGAYMRMSVRARIQPALRAHKSATHSPSMLFRVSFTRILKSRDLLCAISQRSGNQDTPIIIINTTFLHSTPSTYFNISNIMASQSASTSTTREIPQTDAEWIQFMHDTQQDLATIDADFAQAGLSKLFWFDATTSSFDPAYTQARINQARRDLYAANVAGQSGDVATSSSNVAVSSSNVATSSGNVAGSSSDVANDSPNAAVSLHTPIATSTQLQPTLQTGNSTVDTVMKEYLAKKKQKSASQLQEANQLAAYKTQLERAQLETHLPYALGPIDLPNDSPTIITIKKWTREVKQITSSLRIPFLLESDLPVEWQALQDKRNRKHTAEPTSKDSKLTPKQARILLGQDAGDTDTLVNDIWAVDQTQPLILPPPSSWYNGWPRRLYSFHHLHGVQEFNFPWSEFLYAWIPVTAIKPITFAKLSAAFSVWGAVVESPDSDRFVRVRFRSLDHLIRCLFAYVTFKTENDQPVTINVDGESIRLFERCYGLPLIFDPDHSICADPTDPHPEEMLVAAQFMCALDVAEQRIKLVEDALPLNDKPRWWSPAHQRPTSQEILYWLRSEENRLLNERAWADFNSHCIYIHEGRPVSLMAVIPAAGMSNKMASINRVYYRPNAIKPIVHHTPYSNDLAPDVAYLPSCMDVVRAHQTAQRETERVRTLRYIIDDAKARVKSGPNIYNLAPKTAKNANEITPLQRAEWNAEVLLTYARQELGFAIPLNNLPTDLRAIADQGTWNHQYYQIANPVIPRTPFSQCPYSHLTSAQLTEWRITGQFVTPDEAALRHPNKVANPLCNPPPSAKAAKTKTNKAKLPKTNTAAAASSNIAPSSDFASSSNVASHSRSLSPSLRSSNLDPPSTPQALPMSFPAQPSTSHGIPPTTSTSQTIAKLKASSQQTPRDVPPSERAAASRRTRTQQPQPSSSGVNIDVIDIGTRLEHVALQTRTASGTLCQTLHQIYDEMAQSYASLKSQADDMLDNIKKKLLHPTHPKQSISELTSLSEKADVHQDVIASLKGRRRSIVAPIGANSLAHLPNTIRNYLHEQLVAIEKAVQLNTTRLADVSIDGDARNTLAAEQKLFKLRLDGIHQYLNYYDAHGNLKPHFVVRKKKIVHQRKKATPAKTTSLSAEPAAKLRRVITESSDDEQRQPQSAPITDKEPQYQPDDDASEQPMEHQPTNVPFTITRTSDVANDVAQPVSTADNAATNVANDADKPVSSDINVAKNVANVANVAQPQSTLSQDVILTSLPKSALNATDSSEDELEFNSPPINPNIPSPSNLTSANTASNSQGTIVPDIIIGASHERLYAADLFSIHSLLPLHRLRTHDWVCDVAPDACNSLLIEHATSLHPFAVAPSCPTCDGPHRQHSCPQLFAQGWPAIVDDRLSIVTATSQNNQPCRTCRSTLHATHLCPSWQSELLLLHELSQYLANESNLDDYRFESLQQRDIDVIYRFTPIRDDLELVVYGATPYTPLSFSIADQAEYFRFYGSALIARSHALRNLSVTYELTLEWYARELQRASTSLASNDRAIQQLRDDYTTILILWACLHDGCLLQLKDLPSSLLTRFQNYYKDKLSKQLFIFLWLHPSRDTLGWVLIQQPNENSLVFNVAQRRFVLYRQHQSRFRDVNVSFDRPLEATSYSNDVAQYRPLYANYLSTHNATLFARQLSFLHFLQREQLLLNSNDTAFRPSHARRMLNDYYALHTDVATLSTISHLRQRLVRAEFDQVSRFLLPDSAPDAEQRSFIEALRHVFEPFTYVRITYSSFGVMRDNSVLGNITDYPDSYVVVDEFGTEHLSSDAIRLHLINQQTNRNIVDWLDEQESKLGKLIKTIKNNDFSALERYASTFADPFSRDVDKKVPKWQPSA